MTNFKEIQFIEPVISNPTGKHKHPAAWQAVYNIPYFELTIGAPTETRLHEKIKHFKEFGIILNS